MAAAGSAAKKPQSVAKNLQDEEMKGSDDDEDDEGDVDSGLENDLLPSYQIMLSLISLLTKVEAAKSLKPINSAKMLKQMA